MAKIYIKGSNVSLLLSLNTLLPHSTARLSVRHSAKGQTGVLSMTPDPAVTLWPQIHQSSVTAEFTGVIYCSKTHRASSSHVHPQIIVPRRAVLLAEHPGPGSTVKDKNSFKAMENTCRCDCLHSSIYTILQRNEM